MSIEAMKYAYEVLWSLPYRDRCIWRAKEALYLAIEQAEKQEPVAWQATADKCQIETVPAKGGLLPTAPPQRQPLTPGQLIECMEAVNVYGTKYIEFARAIERKHGIRGGE